LQFWVWKFWGRVKWRMQSTGGGNATVKVHSAKFKVQTHRRNRQEQLQHVPGETIPRRGPQVAQVCCVGTDDAAAGSKASRRVG
jgi:hypothetical protein